MQNTDFFLLSVVRIRNKKILLMFDSEKESFSRFLEPRFFLFYYFGVGRGPCFCLSCLVSRERWPTSHRNINLTGEFFLSPALSFRLQPIYWTFFIFNLYSKKYLHNFFFYPSTGSADVFFFSRHVLRGYVSLYIIITFFYIYFPPLQSPAQWTIKGRESMTCFFRMYFNNNFFFLFSLYFVYAI